MNKLSIYVHFPFCASRCHYCDFVSNTSTKAPFWEYHSALAGEWEVRKPLADNAQIVSLYIGGGTPSLWPADDIVKFLSLFSLSSDAEITVEANPQDANRQWFETLLSIGVTRFSLGAQAFDEERLRWLGRRHTIEETKRAVQIAREAGAVAISLDLIFGSPGHKLETLEAELDELVALAPEHVSAYELTVADNTRLGQWVREGQVTMPAGDDIGSMWTHIGQRLAREGFERYEVSNYARGNQRSVHNMRYWQGEPYLALGQGAHGFFKESDGVYHRYMNTKKLEEYLEGVAFSQPLKGVGPGGVSEVVSKEQHAVELLMLGLRTSRGVDLSLLEQILDEHVFSTWQERVGTLVARGLLGFENQFLQPTADGMIVADGLTDFIIS